mmetsp:Transcript_11949/g.17669  ORF Transcript_11949/g.17669 Transcript_11949/m.17669 type:complete len:203 (+) Transcript_11949:410-1018(+)
MTALHLAAEEDRAQMAAKIVTSIDEWSCQLFDSEDMFGMAPLYIASVMGHNDVVDFLAPVSDIDRLNRAALNRSRVMGKRGGGGSGGGGGGGGKNTSIIDASITSYTTSQPALLAATTNNHVEVIKSLLTYGADVNQTDDAGHTAISIAARNGYYWACQVLLEYKADVTIQSKKGGGTPLQKARKYRHFQVVELFESHLSES